MKKTKIVCSIGPASNDVSVMEKMVEAGMNVARVNFSHSTLDERQKVLDSVNELREKTHINLAIMWDTKGPEFRCGVLEDDTLLKVGNTIRIVKEEVVGNKDRFSVNHPEAIDDLKVGSIVLLENAKMKLEVISKERDGVTCNILAGGVLGSHKSMSVPGVKLNIPYVSEDDLEDIKYACLHGGEYLAISFVSHVEDVLQIKEILKKYNREDMQIICKIESELGIENVESILKVSDGIMVARGDLGTEVASESLPIIQKKLIKKSREMGKICIVATEMLETMMENNRPKRAETSDIANAVLDGTDAVMLSGETTVGKHPIETVSAMARICEVTEQYADFSFMDINEQHRSVPLAIAESVVSTSKYLDAKLICAATMSGATAKLISNFKPKAPILALCSSEEVSRRLALNWGVYTKVMPKLESTDEVLNRSLSLGKEFLNLETNDVVVLTGGFPASDNSITNLMKIEKIK